jgi:hypothetical protein
MPPPPPRPPHLPEANTGLVLIPIVIAVMLVAALQLFESELPKTIAGFLIAGDAISARPSLFTPSARLNPDPEEGIIRRLRGFRFEIGSRAGKNRKLSGYHECCLSSLAVFDAQPKSA